MRFIIIFSSIGLLVVLFATIIFINPFQTNHVMSDAIVSSSHHEKVTAVSEKKPHLLFLLADVEAGDESKKESKGKSTPAEDNSNNEQQNETSKENSKEDQPQKVEQKSREKVTYKVEKANGNYIVQTNSLNVRSGADISFDILGKVKLGAEVKVTGETDNGWYQISFKDQKGFVNGSYLTDKMAEQETEKEEITPKYVNGVLLANKEYPLPPSFAPGESKEARNAFNKMKAKAKKDGFELTAFSTYRSYEYQEGLYARYVAEDGKEAADRYSARPGYSEHQTGLSFDIGEVGSEGSWFQESDATRWMAKHAHKYGFIVRYPEGKEHITGYMYEPWHMRYLGVGLATEVYESGLTLEEFLGVK